MEEFRRQWERLTAEAPKEADALRRELVELLAPFDVFDVLASLWMVHTPVDPNSYRESTHQGLMAVPDYVALVCSQRPSRHATTKGRRLVEAPVLDRIDELVKQILGLTDLYLTHQARSDERTLGHLHTRMASRRMYVQGPGFEFQERRVLENLFGDERTEQDLRGSIGFTAADGLAIGDAILEVSLGNFAERSEGGRAIPQLIESRLGDEKWRQWFEETGLPAERLTRMSRRECEQLLRSYGRLYSFSGLGSTMQVREEEVAQMCGVAPERVRAFFETFSTSFGQPDEPALGIDVHRIRERPLMADGEGNFLLVSHLALFCALRPTLEASLKDGGAAWHRYRQRRASFVETAALEHLAAAMPGSRAFESVRFKLQEEGVETEYEIDGLVICDTVMLIIEGKSASLTPAGRRGAPGRVKKHLEEILVKAAEQAERARRTLDEGHPFFDSDGNKIKLPEQVSEIFPIVVTLEDLSDVTTEIWELADAGLLPSDVPAPWAVSLFELELIADLTEYAAMLVQFLRRRARLNELRRVRASDELDWWMYYLERGLYFERDFERPEAPTAIWLQSMTDPIDAYYLWQYGNRTKPAKRPRQKLQSGLRSLLDCLRDRALPGYLEASIALLDFDEMAREDMVRGFRRIREMTNADGEFHNFSMVNSREGSFGITFMAGPGDDVDALERRLTVYSMAKKHQTRLRKWVVFGWCADTAGSLDVVGVVVGEWHPDEYFDGILEEMGLEPSQPVSDDPSRNAHKLPKSAVRPPAARQRSRSRRR